MGACLHCGQALGPDARFCPRCGARLGDGAPAAPARQHVAGRHRGGSGSWAVLKRLLQYYGWLLGLNLVLGLCYHLTKSPWVDLAGTLTWALLAALFLRREWRQVRGAFRWRGTGRRSLLPLAAGAAALVVFLNLYFAVLQRLGFALVDVGSNYLKVGWPLWSAFALDAAVPGIFEEIAFRGVIQTRLAQVLTRNEALIMQAALFSVLHLAPGIFISHFFMGLFLGWVRQRTGRVYAGMLLHMTWNAWVILEVLARP